MNIGERRFHAPCMVAQIPFHTTVIVVHRPSKARPIVPEMTVTNRSKSGYKTLSQTARMNVDTFVQTGSTTSCQKDHNAGMSVSRKKAASACMAG